MPPVPAVLGPNGAPVPSEVIEQARRAARLQPGQAGRLRGSLGGGQQGMAFPYDSAQWTSPEMGDWFPQVRSPDAEINLHRDRMVARQRDQVRNDGWATGVVDRILDGIIGGQLTLISDPNYQALSLYDKAFDDTWAEEFQDIVEALWFEFAEDVGHYNDVGRQLSITQQFRLALRHKLIDGESLMVGYWLPERLGRGAAKYATAFQVVDPDRLSNPYQMMDTRDLRGGVEIIPETGERIAYHIRKAHQNDWYNAMESMTWERVEREDPDGFLRVIHDYDQDRAGQNRGVSIFAPVLTRLKMLATYYGIELQAANVASAMGTFITSPFDHELVEQALTGDEGQPGALGAYQDLRAAFHDQNAIMFNRVRVPTLAPGEDIKSIKSERPNANFSPFTQEMLGVLSAASGVSREQVTWDFTKTNYSGARQGIIEAEKTKDRRIGEFQTNTAKPVFSAWLHEAFERPEIREALPRRAPDFLEARTAYSGCYFLGADAGWLDPVAERQGEILGLDGAFSTLERVCAQRGTNWKVNLRKRAREVRLMEELGLPLPQWAGEKVSAMDAISRPQNSQSQDRDAPEAA